MFQRISHWEYLALPHQVHAPFLSVMRSYSSKKESVKEAKWKNWSLACLGEKLAFPLWDKAR
jgi:hypothetical protein